MFHVLIMFFAVPAHWVKDAEYNVYLFKAALLYIYAREADFKIFRTKKKDRVLNLSFVSMIYTHMAMSYSMCSRHNPFAGAVFSSLGGTAGLFFSAFFAPAVAPPPSFCIIRSSSESSPRW